MPEFAPTPTNEKLVTDQALAYDMAKASNYARSEAAESRMRMDAEPGTSLAATEKVFNQQVDSVAARQEEAVQTGTTPEAFSSKEWEAVRERSRKIGNGIFLATQSAQEHNKAA